ncbi:hydrolase [Vibrio sagamiensis NBRC 104589]|uniref:Hydrolase n=1 Tax=Vibrio sagamiensis NBRC 104589 TaxID=1219064 RepID=A0A511QC32_9VIBR|nr:hydrolase [Vibrio sagamiensis NBRC 104589]
MINERTFPLSTGTLAALELGQQQPAGTSVIFIHGWLDNAGSFKAIMETMHQLAPDLHLLAIDLFGHGLSSHKAADNYYVFHDYVDDLHRLLSDLSSNHVVLVGHSLGALIASCYSAAFPEHVQALVQIEGAAPLSEDPSYSAKRLRDGVLSRQRLRSKVERGMASLDVALSMRMQVNQLTEEQLMPIVERGTEFRNQQWYWRYDRKLKCSSLYRMAQHNALAFIQEIRCPHLLILGDKGFPKYQLTPASWGENQPQVVIVQGGHHCHLEQKLEISKLILGVVNKI